MPLGGSKGYNLDNLEEMPLGGKGGGYKLDNLEE